MASTMASCVAAASLYSSARGQEKDGDRDAGVVEVAGGDEAIAAVIAGAGEDEDGGGRGKLGVGSWKFGGGGKWGGPGGDGGAEELQGKVGDGATGIFHEDEDGNVEFLDSAVVELAEGLAREDERGAGIEVVYREGKIHHEDAKITRDHEAAP